jgi:hypothetical protein
MTTALHGLVVETVKALGGHVVELDRVRAALEHVPADTLDCVLLDLDEARAIKLGLCNKPRALADKGTAGIWQSDRCFYYASVV